MASGGGVAAWVYDSIISSGVNRWGRDVHCIVGILGSVTTRYDSVITRKGEGGRSVDINGLQRPLASLLHETNYASLTTKCLIMPGVCTVPDTSPRPSAFHDSSSVQLAHCDPGETNPFVQYLLYKIQYNVGSSQTRDPKPVTEQKTIILMSDTMPRLMATRLRIKGVNG